MQLRYLRVRFIRRHGVSHSAFAQGDNDSSDQVWLDGIRRVKHARVKVRHHLRLVLAVSDTANELLVKLRQSLHPLLSSLLVCSLPRKWLPVEDNERQCAVAEELLDAIHEGCHDGLVVVAVVVFGIRIHKLVQPHVTIHSRPFAANPRRKSVDSGPVNELHNMGQEDLRSHGGRSRLRR